MIVSAVMHRLLLRLRSGICFMNFRQVLCFLHNFVIQFTTASLIVGFSNL
jgi:hypothetical protein